MKTSWGGKNNCGLSIASVDRVPPRERKEALAVFKERFPPKTRALVIQDFERARTLKEELRERFSEVCR